MKRKGYYTTYRWPHPRVERRIKIPQPIKRPLRFQLRSIIRHDLIQKDPWWFTFHRRGPRGRPKVGIDPLEARAVPKSLIRGTLPERIIYKYLLSYFKFIPGIDFTFQSSLQGGRIEVGGIVADFLFEYMRIVIQVQGPTHLQYLRILKDEEQRLALAELGYDTYYLDVDEIYNESILEEKMRRIFNWLHGVGSSAGMYADNQSQQQSQLNDIYSTLADIQQIISG